MNNAIYYIDVFILSYFLLLNGFYIILLFTTIPELMCRFKEVKTDDIFHLLTFDITPPVSILLPTYNECEVILSAISAALQTELTHYEVIVIDDGSTDRTMQLLIDTYQLIRVPPAVPTLIKTAPVIDNYRSNLHPKLLVVHKENGGREDALNAGINASTTPFFMIVDADSLIEPDTLHRLMQHLLTRGHICAMGGTLCILNGCITEKGKIKKVKLPPSFFGKMQVIEYLRAFFFGRVGWNHLGGSFLISGGFGLFNKHAVLSIKGFKNVLAGDLEITLNLHKKMHSLHKPYVIDYVYDAIVWTDVPQTYSALAKQRIRWQSSIVDVCWRDKSMLFNPKYGWTGLLHLPYLVFGELLGPLVEGFGYLYILFCYFYGVLNFDFFWYFILIAWGFSMFLSLCSLSMHEVFLKKYTSFKEISKLLGLILLENIAYRPLSVWWRVKGFFRYFTKRRFMREKVERPVHKN